MRGRADENQDQDQAGVSLRGVHDLAGNHREWTWTETRGRSYALGGAWNEPSYFLMESEARPPLDRDQENGFRCVKDQDGKVPPARYAGTLDKSFRDYSREKPASDEAFRIFGSFYPRDTGPLEPRVESEDASPENWTKLKVSYSAGYGGERLPAYLFLPKNAVPPYQAVVWFPGGGALQIRKSDALDASIDFMIQSGRGCQPRPANGGSTPVRAAGISNGSGNSPHTMEYADSHVLPAS